MGSIESIPPRMHGAPDLAAASVETLETEIATLAASISVATWRLLKLVAELDRRAPWGAQGLASCAHWLNWKCGIALGAAREKVRVAHALEALPLIDAAFAAGRLSYSKVRAMTRIATAESQHYLLSVAEFGTASHMETLVRGCRRAQRLEQARDAFAQRALSWTLDEDGSMVFRLQLPAEQGALVMKAIQAAVDEMRAERTGSDRGIDSNAAPADVSAETSWQRLLPRQDAGDPAAEPLPAWRADALCRIAEQFLASESVPSRQAERYQVVVHVQAEEPQPAAADGTADACCTLEQGQALATETARRIGCDAALVRLTEDRAGNVLDIGRRSRSIPPSIRRALQRRDGCCRFPGCLNHRYVDAHHVRHWAAGGETRLDNLVLLCRLHHHLLHEEGYSIRCGTDGSFAFFTPAGRPIPAVPRPPAAPPIDELLNACGLDVSAETFASKWQGERLDAGDAVAGLLAAMRPGHGPQRAQPPAAGYGGGLR